MGWKETKEYDTKGRFCSYWHQINEIVSLSPKRILEVGIGTGFVASYLKKYYNLNLISTDCDKGVKSDCIASVTSLPFKDYKFDVVSCFQVLEHLPFSEFKKAVSELRRVSSKYVLISLPDSRKQLKISIPFLREKTFPLPFIKSETDETHYWEIDYKEHKMEKLLKIFEEVGLQVKKKYSIYENENILFVFERVMGTCI